MSFATAVMIDESSLRSIAGRPAARMSATTSIASVAEPPLPRASNFPPAANDDRSESAAAAPRPPSRNRPPERVRGARQRLPVATQSLLSQLPNPLSLHQHRPPYVIHDGLQVALPLGEERVEKARRAGVMHALFAAPLE